MIMIKKSIVIAVAIVSLVVFFASGCYKSTTVDLNTNLEITRDISFATDVVPILENRCSLSGCHNANGVTPNLSTDKAFLSLTTSDYLDLDNPENSELYGLVSGQLTPAMPIGGADPVIAATILAWIKQGAQNN
jgi:hypothetical protein